MTNDLFFQPACDEKGRIDLCEEDSGESSERSDGHGAANGAGCAGERRDWRAGGLRASDTGYNLELYSIDRVRCTYAPDDPTPVPDGMGTGTTGTPVPTGTAGVVAGYGAAGEVAGIGELPSELDSGTAGAVPTGTLGTTGTTGAVPMGTAGMLGTTGTAGAVPMGTTGTLGTTGTAGAVPMGTTGAEGDTVTVE